MSGSPTPRGTVGLIGAGPVGAAVFATLVYAGWRAGRVASRRIASARSAVALAGDGQAIELAEDTLAGADLLLLAVPDREIAGVAAGIAKPELVPPHLLALHFSGALSSEILAPLRSAGAAVGSIHPLASFTDAASGRDRLADCFLFYEGDDPERIRRVAEDLGGRPVLLDAERKTLYHAGAAAACNLAVAMIDLGTRLMEAAGIDRKSALLALLPLLKGTVANLAESGLPRALTGPVARGDVETVSRHLEEIARTAPDLLDAYREASRYAVRIGREKGTLEREEAERLLELFDEFRSAS